MVEVCRGLWKALEHHKLESVVESERVSVSHLQTQVQAMLGKLE